jgi:uncharacterized protein (DUF488 family)
VTERISTPPASRREPPVWTIGHGSRALEEFLALLRESAVARLVDVRAYPASRRHPHFARGPLEKSLAQAGVHYAWEGKALGGRRLAAGASPHVALTHPQFRAYADHMMTAAFEEGLERVVRMAQEERTAIMCAERAPAECHRSLISDALVAQGIAVVHIVAVGSLQSHALNPLARRVGSGLVYDAGTQLLLES